MIKVLPPKTAKEVVARERERKARTTLLMALPEDHLAKFHKMADAKEITNDVSTAYSVSSPSVSKSQKEGSSSYINEVIHLFFANQSSAPQLDYDDLEQINDDDMEEMDLKWQGILLETAELKGTKTVEEEMMGTIETKLETMVGPAYQDDSKALVTIDGEDIDWSRHVKEDAQNYAMMAYSSSNSGSDNEVSDLEDTSVNDRYADGMHAVPPPMTGNYMHCLCAVKGNGDTAVKASAGCNWRTKEILRTKSSTITDDLHRALKDKGIIDSRYSRHMTGNKAHLADYQEFKGGSVAFGCSNGRITGKGKIKAGRLDFEDDIMWKN
nr:ribonuclease H-like domain-containing protein [Tanacetum cinerariifolium]